MMLNKAQAEKLFAENAVLLGTQDAVPLTRLCEICGPEAAEYAIKTVKAGTDYNVYGCRGKQIPYVTKSGFLIAVSHMNALECAERSTP